MEKKVTIRNLSKQKYLDAKLLISNAYDDYLAARVLLNIGLLKQGITLASSAIEKYIKAYLTCFKVSYKSFHLDDLSKVQKHLDNTPYKDVLSTIDKNFLLILSKAYKWRYHDRLDEDSIGFVPNQFLGELDSLFSRMEKNINSPDSAEWRTVYKTDVEAKNPHLFENNFVLTGIDKNEFMTKPSTIIFFYYEPSQRTMLTIRFAKEIVHPYSGEIILFNVSGNGPGSLFVSLEG